MLIWTAGWSIAIRRVDVLHDKILWSGRERVGENTQKKFRNEESENRMKWKD